MPTSRFHWRHLFARSRTAVFVLGSTRRLRYANPAWEAATGEAFAKYRSVKFTRLGTESLPGTLAPPPEVWAGTAATVRRPAPGQTAGPPWWDVAYTPLAGADAEAALGVLGTLRVVPASANLPRRSIPAGLGAAVAAVSQRYPLAQYDGAGLSAQKLAAQVRAATLSELPVWMIGEAGTGKLTAARTLHHNGPRRERGFVHLRCGAVPPYILDGMLFGKGGLAHGKAVGTLALHHPQRWPPDVQSKVWAWVQRATGPRLICLSDADAQSLHRAGRLTVDYATRGCAIELTLPALRHQPEQLLAALHRYAGRPIAADVVEIALQHNWPGNYAELAAVGRRATGPEFAREQLPRFLQELSLAPLPAVPPPPTLAEATQALAVRYAESALARHGGDRRRAAKQLGVPLARFDSLAPPPGGQA